MINSFDLLFQHFIYYGMMIAFLMLPLFPVTLFCLIPVILSVFIWNKINSGCHNTFLNVIRSVCRIE